MGTLLSGVSAILCVDMELAPLERRRALLAEGRRALLKILGVAEIAEGATFQQQGLLKGHVGGLNHDVLRETLRQGRTGRQHLGVGQGLVEQACGRVDAVAQPATVGVLSVEVLSKVMI